MCKPDVDEPIKSLNPCCRRTLRMGKENSLHELKALMKWRVCCQIGAFKPLVFSSPHMFEHETMWQLKLIPSLTSVKQILSKTTTELTCLPLSTLEHICSWGCTQYCSQIHPPLSDNPLDTFQYSGDFHNMSRPSWEISLSAPTNSLLSLSKMGFRRLQERKLRRLCWETFAVNAVIDLIGPLWLLWSGITLFYHRMHLLPLGLTTPSIRFCVELMQWLETNGQAPFSPPVRQNTHSNFTLMDNSLYADSEYICMNLECTQQVDLQEVRVTFDPLHRPLMVLEMIK